MHAIYIAGGALFTTITLDHALAHSHPMKPLLTRSNIAELDAACVEQVPGMTHHVLMENAGRASANILRTLLPKPNGLRILIACGGGNNGGDGLVIARHLRDEHEITLLRNDEDAWDSLADTYDVVIDALIGVGGGTDLRLPVAHHVQTLNAMRGLRVAVDVPTGLDATTGLAHPHAFRAHNTITMAVAKPGFYRNEGPAHVGTVYIADIGAPAELIKQFSRHAVLQPSDIRTWLPARSPHTSKFDYGRVLVVGGSRSMRGAPALSAHAALVAGAGIVDLAAPVLHPLIPREVMTHVLASRPPQSGTAYGTPTPDYSGSIARHAFASLNDVVKKATVLAVGPGVGPDPDSTAALADLLNALDPETPVVLDADGLRALPLLSRPMHNVVITPHLGEFSRLTGTDVNVLRRSVVEEALAYAQATGCIVHVKDVPSITTDGTNVIYTINGNPGMATAGSGDVLTGFIAGLCAQHVPVFNAAALGSYLHARAGDNYATHSAIETLTASDLIHALGSVIPNG